MKSNKRRPVLMALTVAAVLAAVLLVNRYQSAKAQSLRTRLIADSRFIQVSVYTYFQNPGHSVYVLTEMWDHPDGPGPTREPDAIYSPDRITRQTKHLRISHPDLDEELEFDL